MNTYEVSLTVKRNKISVIKVIRAITDWNLRDAKTYVEQNFTFRSLDCDWVMFTVTVDAFQMADLAHYIATRYTTYRDVKITHSKIVEKKTNPFDFTS